RRHVALSGAPAAAQISTLSLHDALPISDAESFVGDRADFLDPQRGGGALHGVGTDRQRDVDAVVHDQERAGVDRDGADAPAEEGDRKSTRLNSSHRTISYAVFCLKKKKP